MRGIKKLSGLFFTVMIAVLVNACSEVEQEVAKHPPEMISDDDVCHVCGMSINRFPGPKGQAFVDHQEHSFKFCSTKDMFSWLLQPETASIVRDVYVHDMGDADWATPSDEAFIDATQAWYVSGHEQMGAMGTTLASFSQRSAAEAFANQHGGVILMYDSINLEKLLSASD